MPRLRAAVDATSLTVVTFTLSALTERQRHRIKDIALPAVLVEQLVKGKTRGGAVRAGRAFDCLWVGATFRAVETSGVAVRLVVSRSNATCDGHGWSRNCRGEGLHLSVITQLVTETSSWNYERVSVTDCNARPRQLAFTSLHCALRSRYGTSKAISRRPRRLSGA